jgi:hypothetical protein
MSYGRELLNSLEFHTSEFDDGSKERLLKAGVRGLTAARDSENELDYSIFEAPDNHCEGLSLDIRAMVCPR